MYNFTLLDRFNNVTSDSAQPSVDQPFNLAQYISDHPYQTSLGALGLGGLTYAALGGNEGVSDKIQAMIDNPLATASGLGAAGVLSKITYDALNKEASANDDDVKKGIGTSLGFAAGAALPMFSKRFRNLKAGPVEAAIIAAGGLLGGGLGYLASKPEDPPPPQMHVVPFFNSSANLFSYENLARRAIAEVNLSGGKPYTTIVDENLARRAPEESRDNSKRNAILGGGLGALAGVGLGGLRGGSPSRMLTGLLAGGALGGGLGYFSGKPEEAPPQLYEVDPNNIGGMSHQDFPYSSYSPDTPDTELGGMSLPEDAPSTPKDAPSTPKETGRLGALAGGLGGGLLGAAVPAALMRGSGRGAAAALAGLATAGIGSALGSTYKSSFDPFSFGRGVSDKLEAREKEDTETAKALAKKVIANPLAASTAILSTGGAVEQRSKQENNALAAADNFIDNYGNYLLGGVALGGLGYGGYKLHQYLKDKPRSKTASFGEDYYNVQRRPGDVGIPQILGASTLYGGTLGALTGAGVGVGAGLIAGLTHPRGQKLLAMAENAARYGAPTALSVGALATLGLGGAMLLKKMQGNEENTDSPAERQAAIDYYNQRLLTPGRDSIRSAKDKLLYRILGSSFDKESSSHESKYTAEYNHHSVLQGKQKTELPDFLQKEIIDAKTANYGEDLMDAYANMERSSYLKNMAKGGLIGTGIGAAGGLLAHKYLKDPTLAKKIFGVGALSGAVGSALGTYVNNHNIDVARSGGRDRKELEDLHNYNYTYGNKYMKSMYDDLLRDIHSRKAKI